MEENDRKRKATSEAPTRRVKVSANQSIKKQSKYLNSSSESSAELEEDRLRTPSGTVLPNNIGIRKFFEKKVRRSEEALQNSQEGISRSKKSINRKVISSSAIKRKTSVKAAKKTGHARLNTNQNKLGFVTLSGSASNNQLFSDTDSSSIGSEYLTPNADRSLELQSESEDKETQFLYQLATLIGPSPQQTEEVRMPNQEINQQADINQQVSHSSTTQPNEEMEENTQPNPQVLSIATVLEMLKSVKEEIKNDFNSEFTKARQEDEKIFELKMTEMRQNVKAEVSQSVHQSLDDHPKVKRLQNELSYWKFKTETLTDVCDRLHTEVVDLTTRIDNLELNNSKRMFTISGMSFDMWKEKQDVIHDVEAFLKKAMKLEIIVDDYFVLGALIVIITQTLEDKRLVIKAKSMLKDYRTETGGKVYINEYLPPIAQEKRRRDKDVIQMATPVDPEEEFNVFYDKSGLNLQGNVYKKRITIPTPKDLVNIPLEDLDRILKLSMQKGKEIVQVLDIQQKWRQLMKFEIYT